MNFENWILIIYKPKNQHQERKKEKKGFDSFRFTMVTPPPIKLKQSQTNAMVQTLTAVSSSSTSHDTARLLACEMLHISTNLASSPSNLAEPPLSLADSPESQSLNQRRLGLVEEEYVNSSLWLICCEEIDGHKWNYVAGKDPLFGTLKKNSIHALIF